MKVLIVCSTYFQIISSIKVKQHIYFNDDVSLVLTDMVPDYYKMSERLNETHLFKNVVNFELSGLPSISCKKIKLQHLINSYHYFSGIGELPEYDFDILMGGNIFGPLEIYFNRINNSELQVYLIQDGNYNYCFADINRLINPSYKEIFLHDILKSLRGQYIFHSELGINIADRFISIDIPPISEQDLKILNKVFSYYGEMRNKHNTVFLDQCFEELGIDMNEKSYLDMIHSTCGDVAVKLHPRTNHEKYENVNCEIITGSIPLELLILNEQSIKLLITISSSAGIMPALALDRDIKTVFLYRLEKSKYESIVDYDSFDCMMTGMSEKYKNIIIINSIEEIKSMQSRVEKYE